jgi:hypothetical protein
MVQDPNIEYEKPQIGNITIAEASKKDYQEVSSLVTQLLIELEPDAGEEIQKMVLCSITKTLFNASKIWAFIARNNGNPVGVITLHACAAIYVGGVFGEISELYVVSDSRSKKIGDLLISAAVKKGNQLGWKRLEVGSPPPDESPKTIRF